MEDIRVYFGQVWQTGEGWKANCPRCDDNEKKFAWNEEKGVGCCFHSSCSWFYASGGVTARRLHAFFSRTGFKHVVPQVVEMSEEADIQLPKEFKLIKDSEIGNNLYAYLEHRNIPRKIIDMAKVGYCDSGKYWGYLIFPVFDDVGEVVYWQGRRFKNREPKFWNPKSSKKSDLVYCISKSIRPRILIVVESVINALTLESLDRGKTAIVAILGKSLSEKQADYICCHEKCLREIVVALDGDARRDAVEAVEKLKYLKCLIKIANIPNGEDINSLGREKSWRLIRNAEVYNARNRTEFMLREV